MQNLLSVSIATRNYLPANGPQMTGVINGTSTAYPVLSSQVQTNIQTNAILTPGRRRALAAGAAVRAAIAVRRRRLLSMLSQQTQANASNNFSNVQTLISALGQRPIRRRAPT